MKQHSSAFLDLVNDAKKQIVEISVATLKEQLDKNQGLCVIDVREDNEWLSSVKIPGAIHLGKGIIERDIEKIFPDYDMPLVVYCSGGFRSALTAKSLKEMGYTQVSSMIGGLQAWINANYPTVK